jgi:hypothetical protein
MTGSRLRIVPIILALLAAPAWAQSHDTPPVLTPDDYPPIADDEDTPAPPGATAAPQALSGAGQVTVAPAPQDTGVEVGVLGTTEGQPIGLFDSSNGGLGEDLWGGSERQTIETLLSRVPLVSPDPVLRGIAKRLVLTRAGAPPGASKRALVTVRIEKLLDAGLIDEAGALATQASVPNDPDFARVQADALLTANRAADICGELTAARLTAGETFWLQLRAYCAAAGGDQPTADLTRAVLDAQGNSDKAYDTLVGDVLNHKADPPGPIAHPTAIHLFLLQQAGLPVPGEVAAVMGTGANLLAMRDVRNPPAFRFAAAERIVRTGAVSPDELRKLADAQDIPLSRMANAASDAQGAPFLAGQVLLRRAATIEPRPEAKAQLVFEALTLGDKAGMLPLTAGLQADLVASLRPAPANRGMADLFARALLLANLPEAAARWLDQKDVLATAVDLAAPDPARDMKAQEAYRAIAAALAKNPPDTNPNKPGWALLLGIADVLGRPLPPDAKAQAPWIEAMTWGGKRPASGVMRRIEDASSRADRKGEALLMILDTVRSTGLSDMDPNTTVELVRLVGAMGLPDAARDLGLEALALYVPPPPPAPAR